MHLGDCGHWQHVSVRPVSRLLVRLRCYAIPVPVPCNASRRSDGPGSHPVRHWHTCWASRAESIVQHRRSFKAHDSQRPSVYRAACSWSLLALSPRLSNHLGHKFNCVRPPSSQPPLSVGNMQTVKHRPHWQFGPDKDHGPWAGDGPDSGVPRQDGPGLAGRGWSPGPPLDMAIISQARPRLPSH